MSDQTQKSYTSKKPSLKVDREGKGRKQFIFNRGALVLTDPDEIEEFEALLAQMNPGVRSMIKEISVDHAIAIAEAHRAAMGHQAAHGMTTAERAKQIHAATHEAQIQAEAGAQNVQVEQDLREFSGVVPDDGSSFNHVITEDVNSPPPSPAPVPEGFIPDPQATAAGEKAAQEAAANMLGMLNKNSED